MTRPAVRFLESIIEPTWDILELGAGYSTIWLARRCRSLVSLESNPQWRGDIAVLLEAQGLSCDLRLCHAADFPAQVAQMPDTSVDLVIVDFTEGERASRLACIETAAPKVRPDGYLVLDDSDRPQFAAANELIPEWNPKRFPGMKALPFHATETTFYRKPTPWSF